MSYLFEDKVNLLFQEMGESQKMVLSTSLNNKVSSRMMSVIIIDQYFYLQTDKTMSKFEQIINNPNVALCFGNYQIQGISEVVGTPSSNKEFIELFKDKFYKSYTAYSNLENERLIRIKPYFMKKWIYEDGDAFEEIYDFQNNKYEKKRYLPI